MVIWLFMGGDVVKFEFGTITPKLFIKTWPCPRQTLLQAVQSKCEEGVSSHFINYINSYNFRPSGPNWTINTSKSSDPKCDASKQKYSFIHLFLLAGVTFGV